ncbi:hypothetical protein [Ancylobacter pratisalsi]|uniref:Uncharacterized protein n=1 Tax=Ancylobacter pratisalsi TaxID=1745854 RepID=A0A6P1YI34_9HYPH|nr:hypothetical protein [Ancylobacter pratisalsi]QIB32630.1 hypothetical protein G3A50_02110 [Ancylobacter pratisalsi]
MTVEWPEILKPTRITDPYLAGSYTSGGRTSSGLEQRVYSDAGYWRLSYSIPIRNRAQVLAWRAMAGRLAAGEDMLVRVYDMHRTDGALGDVQEARVAADAAIGSTTIQIEASNLDIEIGAHLTIGARLYRVMIIAAKTPSLSTPDRLSSDLPWDDSAVWLEEPLDAPTLWTLVVLPPVRDDLTTGMVADFRYLALLTVPEDPSSLQLDLDVGKFADPTLALVEAI